MYSIIPEKIICDLILLVHDKRHAIIDNQMLGYLSKCSKLNTSKLYRATYINDSNKRILSYSEDLKIAQDFLNIKNSTGHIHTIEKESIRAFCLYEFYDIILTAEEQKDMNIRELYSKELEWLVINENTRTV